MATMKATSSASYTFTSQPRALAPRRKFREEEAASLETTHFNLMNDPRVVRGNTFRKPLVRFVCLVYVVCCRERRSCSYHSPSLACPVRLCCPCD